MRFTVTIECDNAAFGADDGTTPARGPEVARILRKIAQSVADEQSGDGFGAWLMDANGNKVGRAEFEDAPPRATIDAIHNKAARCCGICPDCWAAGELKGHMGCRYPQD